MGRWLALLKTTVLQQAGLVRWSPSREQTALQQAVTVVSEIGIGTSVEMEQEVCHASFFLEQEGRSCCVTFTRKWVNFGGVQNGLEPKLFGVFGSISILKMTETLAVYPDTS